MKEVVQKNPYGCAIACVAGVLETSYEDALKLFEQGDYKAKNAGFWCKDIEEAFKKAGKGYISRTVRNYTRKYLLQPDSIVFVDYSDRYPAGHYLVRKGTRRSGTWMDPWVNFPKQPREAGFRKYLPGHPAYVIFAV